MGGRDDNNLYIAWQYVDVTDIIDPANAGSAGGGKISNNDGILVDRAGHHRQPGRHLRHVGEEE